MSRSPRFGLAIAAALGAAVGVAAVLSGAIALLVPLAGTLPGDKGHVRAMAILEAAQGMAFFPLFTVPVALFLAWKRADGRRARRTAGFGLAALFVSFALPLAWVLVAPPSAADASERDRDELVAGTIGEGLFDAWLLALVTVPAACFLGWRSRRGEPRASRHPA